MKIKTKIMAKYKLLTRGNYTGMCKGRIYDENYKQRPTSDNVKRMALMYPKDWQLVEELTFPREMMVSRLNNATPVKRTVLGYFNSRWITVYETDLQSFYNNEGYSVATFQYAEELPQKRELTIAEIEEKLGYEIKIVK